MIENNILQTKMESEKKKEISLSLLPFPLDNNIIKYTENRDRVFTHLILMDYDWMKYRLQAEIPIINENVIFAEFEYYGCIDAKLHIEYLNEKAEITISAETLEKFLKKYMKDHIKSWNNQYAFCGENLFISFWNEIMSQIKPENVIRENIQYTITLPIQS